MKVVANLLGIVFRGSLMSYYNCLPKLASDVDDPLGGLLQRGIVSYPSSDCHTGGPMMQPNLVLNNSGGPSLISGRLDPSLPPHMQIHHPGMAGPGGGPPGSHSIMILSYFTSTVEKF